jgi:filamentous hemagglutinin
MTHPDLLFPYSVSGCERAALHPRFRMRLLTLAVLSACASGSMSASNHVAAPVNPLPTGGVVSNPATATIVNSAPNLLQINQTAAQTTIHWNSFDIGQGNTVRFNQPSASAAALNYIGGSNPSVIQGTLSANGKVYLVNSNGILFDGSAQVNVNTLIASSLNISQSTFDNGITASLVGKTDPTLVATMLLNTAGQIVNYGTIRSVKVDGVSGQVVNDASGKPVEEGGAIMLFAQQVENHGLISANNGQVILAAGGSVYLQLYNDQASSSYNANDFSLRGFLVKVTAAPDGALNLSKLIATQHLNSAANLGGEIHSDRGNTTLTGLVVNQSGLISANTATTVNGSIWLTAANYDAASKTTSYGTLTTSKDSVTQTLPEDDGTTLAASDPYTDNSVYNNGSFPHYQAVIKLLGETVVHDGQAIAPGGRIVVGKEYVSNDNDQRPTQSGRVYLGANSVLSTAGMWVDLPYASNYLTFKLGSLDIANAPQQKGDFLINQTVTVDTRKASPLLFDIADKVAAVPQSVLQKASAGGTVSVNTGEFISTTGAKVDVAGGGSRYASGTQTTTYLRSQGRLYDIATAPVNLQYDKVISKTAPVSGYVEGNNAGLLVIDAPQMILAGHFSAGVTAGPYQRATSAMPTPGKLVLGTQSVLPGALDFSTVNDATRVNSLDTLQAGYALHDVNLTSGAATRLQLATALAGLDADPAHAPFPAALNDTLWLPVDLFGGSVYSNAQASATQGFGTLALRANGSITLAQNVTLDLGSGGSLLWLAPQIDIAGTIKAQGGALTFNQTFDHSLYGNTQLGAHSVLSVAGGWINDTSAVQNVANVIDGGTVTIAGAGTLVPGSVIDASGAAMLDKNNTLSYGSGGAIVLPTAALDGVSLLAYGGNHGGSLLLNTDTINVGGHAAGALSADFFTQGGFTQYTLAGLSQVNFYTGLHPVATRRIARSNAQLAPTGTAYADLSTVLTNTPDTLRSAASLTATTAASTSSTHQLGANETGITVAAGASILTDPLGTIKLASQTRLDIEGSLIAPAGTISLSLDSGKAFYYDSASGRFNALRIGDQALISTAGVFLPGVGAPGVISGQVLPGGAVTIKANRYDLDFAQGAVIDVGGSSHVVDLPPGSGRAGGLHPTVASEGGRITISATENAYLDGTFKGRGGDASVAGGSFALNLLYNGAFSSTSVYGDLLLDAQVLNDPNAAVALAFWDAGVHQLNHTIVVSQTATPQVQDGSVADSSVLKNLTDTQGNFIAALRANVSADQLVNGVVQNGVRVGGGFDSVLLNSDNQIRLDAGLSNFAPRARLQLDTPELLVQANGNAQLGNGAAQLGNGALDGTSWQSGQLDWRNTPGSFRLSSNLSPDQIEQYPLLYSVDPGSGNKIPVTDPRTLYVPVATLPGTGELDLYAGQISLAGNVTANGVAALKLASSGDLRFAGFPLGYIAQNSLSDPNPLIAALQALSGRLSVAGNIGLQANQIYPASAVDFTVASEQVAVAPLQQSILNGTVSAQVSRTPIDNGQIVVKGNAGADLAPVLSAGGTLTLNADHIDQGGIIKAPLGTINLLGGRTLTLGDGSVTSVSTFWQHDGIETALVIPYGATQSVGQSLFYGSLPTQAAPAKQISTSAAAVDVASGATLDLRGGGDFSAMEFVPGIGGTRDILAAPGTYAIVPGVVSPIADSYLDSLAPVKLASVGVNAAAAYTTVHLGAGAGLAAGDYALLPAYYALLPGAYLVKTQSGAAYANLDPGYAATQLDGSTIVAGKLGFASTAIGQSTWSGFSVQSGADALNGTHAQAQYLQTGSDFFAHQAANGNTPVGALPQDGGRLSVGASASLVFEGKLLAQAAVNLASGQAGATGEVDLYGVKFAIVDHAASTPAGYTRLEASALSRLDASLLIGGQRHDTPSGQQIDVVASDVLVDLDGGSLTLPELLLVATDHFDVSGASTLSASGSVLSRAGTLTINANPDGTQHGALLALSSAQLALIARAGTLDSDPAHGNLTIAAGAKLNAPGGSIAVDSTGSPIIDGVLQSDTLALGARQIALGAVPQASTALALGNAQLAALGSAKNFVLRSYSSIDFYGDVSLGQSGTGSFTFDSVGLLGHDVNGTSAPVNLSAATITLQNTSGSTLTANAPGSGTLTLAADKLVLADSSTNGAGFTVGGFNQVALNAGEVSLQGSGALNVGADLAVRSSRIAAGGRLADQQIQAWDASQQSWHAVTITRPAGAPALAAAPVAGGKLQIAGSAVDFGGNIDLQSGRLTLAAHGIAPSDGVTLQSAAAIDVSGYEKTFAQGTANLTQSASAGRVALTSDNGSVAARAGSTITLQGAAAGGDAGELNIAAANGTVTLDGALAATATAGNSGSARIDATTLGNFSALNSALQQGGFNASRYLRARNGDIEIAASDIVTAHSVQLVADAGAIKLEGSIDASGVAGEGGVEFDAGLGIHLHAGSRILASGTATDTTASAAYSSGGQVALYARNGALDFDPGALIDVSAASAGKSSGGKVVFSAPRTANEDGVQASLGGQLKLAGGAVSVAGGQTPQPGQIIVEGFQTYSGITATSSAASTSSAVYADFSHFMNAADSVHDAAFATLLNGGSDLTGSTLKVRAGVELVSSGDLTVDAGWDLTSASWLPTGVNQSAGRLVLRAAGNLAVNARLGLPNDSAIPPDAGWSLQLAGGADTASADGLAVINSTTQGDVSLSSAGKVTTSTGDIQIAAGRDFSAASPASVVYTTGRALALPVLAADPLLAKKQFAPASGVNFVDGGSIAIKAGRNLSGSGGYADVNDWLRRNSVVQGTALTTSITDARGYAYQPAYWWVDRLGNSTAKTKGIEGIATLGGGNIDIVAGNTISNLSVASATSRSAATTATLVNVNNRNTIPNANAVYGGGDVRIDAGGDLLGGRYLIARGTANLSAGGDIGGVNGVAATAPALWLMGYSDDPARQGATVAVEALGNVTLGSVANPTVAPVAKNAGTSLTNTTVGYRATPAFFFSYAPQDSIAINAVGGELVINPLAGTNANNVLPPRYAAVALAGSISSGASLFDAQSLKVAGSSGLSQFPDRNGQFLLLAGDSVHDLVLNPSDYAPPSLSTAGNQTLAIGAFPSSRSYSYSAPQTASPRLVTAATLAGYRYAVVAANGSVSNGAFYFPQQSVVAAGQDIANVQLDLQNLGADDFSHLVAGRDLVFSNALSNGTLWGNQPHIQIAGPGNLVVEAGRDINLGAVSTAKLTAGDQLGLNDVSRIDAIGNTGNASLPTVDAANLTLLAGINGGSLSSSLNVAQVDSLFAVLRSVGQFQGLLGQLQSKTLSDEAAIINANAVIHTVNAAIDAVFAGQVAGSVTPLHEALIVANGKTAAAQVSAAYNAALAAANNVIAALFAGGQMQHGDISLYNARISSNANPGGAGGTINLLAPHGDIKVGLPTASSGRNIGIYTTSGGAINAYLSGDMNVNLSKVATFQGGDILLYTSGNGSTLDAGRGSRSARTSSPPRIVAERRADGTPTGKLLLLPPLDVSGSGIRTVSYDPDGFGPLQQPQPGRVYLLAPSGTIDAGEAGVSSASGLVVAALVVKNADNFSASGGSVGVPSAAGAAVAAPVSGDAAASANKATDALNQTGNALAKNDTDLKAFKPAFVSVEVLDFGGESPDCKQNDPSCHKQK